MVFEYDVNGAEGCVSASLSESIDCHMYAGSTREDSGQGISDSKVIIIVCVEVESYLGVSIHHFRYILRHLQGIEDPEGIGEHESINATVFQSFHHLHDIVRRVSHSVRPILKIEIDAHAF